MSGADRRSGGPASTRGERLRADLILLAVALVWGSGFIGGRVAGQHLNSFVYNGARFLLGSLSLLLITGRRLRGLERREVWGGALAGVILVAASNLQQVGLQFTTAGKAGFITGLYVVLVPLVSALVWRRAPSWLSWMAAIVATVGLFLLSGVRGVALAPGDGWVLAGALFWALHILTIASLAPKTDVLRLGVVQFTVCGALSSGLGLALDPEPFAGWGTAWWAIVYNGVLSAGLGFTLQILAQRHTPATDTAVILSLEAVFAGVFGWLLLAESLTATQLVGCGLMLAGMVLAQSRALRGAPARSA